MGNPLFSTAVAAAAGYENETFDHPAATELMDEVAYPELPVSAYRSNTGELFQDGAPQYAGKYELAFMDAPGVLFDNSSYSPAPGSEDLIAPRFADGVGGTNRIIKSEGPVSGSGSDGGTTWSGNRAELNRPNPNYAGPVVGGPDYANSLGAAYYADTLAGYSEIASTSAMVSAV